MVTFNIVINKRIPLTVAFSPSELAIRCMAVAAIPIGTSKFKPSTLVDVFLFDTSISTRGRIRNLEQINLLLAIKRIIISGRYLVIGTARKQI